MSIFKIVTVTNEVKLPDSLIRGKWQFFIPGISSGVYSPASLHIQTWITIHSSTIFGKLRKRIYAADTSLSKEEFDALYDEMSKIKELRDNKTFSK